MHDPAASTSRRADGSAVLFTLAFPTLVTWVYFVLLKESPPGLQQTVYGIGKTLQFGFPVVWVVAVQRRGLGCKAPGRRGLVEGFAFGLAVFAAALLVYHAWLKPAGYFDEAAEQIEKKVVGFGVNGFWSYVALGAFYSLFHSFLEEYYWRWFVFGQLRRLVSLRAAILVSSVGFMAHHVLVLGVYFGWFSVATVLFSLAVAVGGAVWAWIYQRSDSLYTPWLSHLLVDAAIFAIGYDMVRPLLV